MPRPLVLQANGAMPSPFEQLFVNAGIELSAFPFCVHTSQFEAIKQLIFLSVLLMFCKEYNKITINVDVIAKVNK
jgi:hypothetical protein